MTKMQAIQSTELTIDRSQIPELTDLDFALLTRCVLTGKTSWTGAATELRQGIRKSSS